MKTHKIAVIAGDGIGKEVMPEGIRVVEAAARRFNIRIEWTRFEWASCDYYAAHGKMLPDDWFEQLKGYEAIFFGAVGWPGLVPDHISISMLYWDERVAEMAKDYPDVTWDQYHIDILAARFVLSPERFDVVVASNLLGDILSDLGPACTGTIGIAPSANLNPQRQWPSLFEPVHGSVPDIYGRNIANPVAMIWSGAMMPDFLGNGDDNYRAAHDAIVAAIEDWLLHGEHTPDMGGTANTNEAGQAIAARLQAD